MAVEDTGECKNASCSTKLSARSSRRGRWFLFLSKVIQLTLSFSQVSLTHSFKLTAQLAQSGLVVAWKIRDNISQFLVSGPEFFLGGWPCTRSWTCFLYPLGTHSDCDLLLFHSGPPLWVIRSTTDLLTLVGLLSGCNLSFVSSCPLFYCSRCLEKLHVDCSAVEDLLI